MDFSSAAIFAALAVSPVNERPAGSITNDGATVVSSSSAVFVPRQWRTAAALAVWSSLLLPAAVVGLRRLAGALAAPVSFWPAVVVVSLAAGLSILAWLCWLWDRWEHRPLTPDPRPLPPLRLCWLSDRQARLPVRAQIAAAGLALATPLLWGLVLSPRPLATLGWLSAIMIAAAGFVLAAFLRARQPRRTLGWIPHPSAPDAPDLGHGAGAVEIDDPTGDSPPFAGESQAFPVSFDRESGRLWIEPAHRVLQWSVRTATDDGAEHLIGAVAVHFAAQGRQAVIHLSFNPPFAARPEFECEPEDAGLARLKITAVYPYGARIEVKRPNPTSIADDVEVRFQAVASSRE